MYEKNMFIFFKIQNLFLNRFLAWGSYRYGNLSVEIPQKWKLDKIKNFSVIKLREYKLSNPDNKIIFNKVDEEVHLIKKYLLIFFNLVNAF